MENITGKNSEFELAIQKKLNNKAKLKSIASNILPFAGLFFVFFLFLVVTDGRIINPSNIENLINQA